MTPPLPDEIVRFCRDCFLLARYATPGENGCPDGRAWEQAVSSLLWRPEFTRRQHAGTLGLFGAGSASGIDHELDGAGHGAATGVWIEAKARAVLGKADVALFDFKCRDLYIAAVRGNPGATAAVRWWPVLVSSEPAPDPVRRLCLAEGIVLCEPTRLPLPVVLRIAANPEADLHLTESLLGEAVRLFEPACRSMQERFVADASGRSLALSVGLYPTPSSLSDALFAQDELTADVLDYMELEAPGALEARADLVASRVAAHARAGRSGWAIASQVFADQGDADQRPAGEDQVYAYEQADCPVGGAGELD